MRGHLASVIAIATTIVSSTLSARSQEIPTLDVKPVCRGIANQSADPGVGQGSQDETYRQCIETEQATREQIEKEWPTFSAADKRHCVVLATTGGDRATLNSSRVWKWRGMSVFLDRQRLLAARQLHIQIHTFASDDNRPTTTSWNSCAANSTKGVSKNGRALDDHGSRAGEGGDGGRKGIGSLGPA